MNERTCLHCRHTGPGVRAYRNVWDEDRGPDGLPKAESFIGLCSDVRACAARLTAPTGPFSAVIPQQVRS